MLVIEVFVGCWTAGRLLSSSLSLAAAAVAALSCSFASARSKNIATAAAVSWACPDVQNKAGEKVCLSGEANVSILAGCLLWCQF
jgi:hypothetical protein